jgi:hypothetical protein
MTGQEKYATKIAGLLRKAESTTPEEAELLVAKAQELMTKYAIDEQMLAVASGKTADDAIEQRTLVFVGIFRDTQLNITSALKRVNNCKAVYIDGKNSYQTRTVSGKSYKDWTELVITGYRTDLDRLELMNASLQIQCAQALSSWYKSAKQAWWSKTDTFRERRTFIHGFAQGVQTKLTLAAQAGKNAAKAAEAERTHTSAHDASDSVELVLRNRKDTVQDWYDKHYGNTLRSKYTRVQSGSRSAADAGRAAGASADVGQSGLRSAGALKS